MATREQLEKALINADAAGDVEAAKALASALKAGQYDRPSEMEAVSQVEPQKPAGGIPGKLPIVGVAETAATIGSGLASTVAGGIAGLARTGAGALFGEEGAASKGAQLVRDIQTAGTYQPKTEAGQVGLEAVGTAANTLGKIPAGLAGLGDLATGGDLSSAVETIEGVESKGVGGSLGEKAFEVTGSPLLAAAAEASPDAVGALIPAIAGMKTVQKATSATKQAIADRIKAGDTSSDLVKYMIADSGDLAKDRAAKEALKQGFDPAVVQAIKSASPLDKAKSLQMLDILEKGKKDAVYRNKNRPTDVVGHSAVRRVNYLRDLQKKAGEQLDSVAKSLKGARADFEGPVNTFLAKLDDMGVGFDDKLRPSYRGSDVQGLKEPQAAINAIVQRMKDVDGIDAHEMHRLKKYIDNVVTYGGKDSGGMKGQIERVLKDLRHNLDSSLDANFPEYNKVNTQYAESKQALDALQKAAGTSIDMAGRNADKAMGTVLRRLLSNAQSRVTLVNAIDDVNNVSKKYGAKFNDDIMTQMTFADELDSVFGPAAKTSLAGEVQKAGRSVAETAIGDRSVRGSLAEGAGKAIEKAQGINEENAIKAMRAILERGQK